MSGSHGGGGASSLNRRSNTNLSASSSNRRNQHQQYMASSLSARAIDRIETGINQMRPVLTNSQLKNLTEHRYSSQGSTLLDPIFQPYWRWLVEKVPLNVAPNLLTIVGLIINIISSTILILYSPNASDEVPGWALLLCSFGLFAYQSLDAIDGKQARRTNSSTPLGELFDHGCDAISTVFVAIALSVSLRYGEQPWLMFLLCFMGMSAFYIAHWQTYVTGTLTFGKIDVTEAQLTVYTIYFLTALFGDWIWTFQIPFIGLEIRYIPAIIAIVGPLNTIFSNIKSICGGGTGRNGASVADTSIVFPVFPLALFLFLVFSVASRSTTQLYVGNTCLYVLTFGFVWSKITIKLIVAHMTKGEIYMTDSCLTGPALLFVNQYFGNIIPEIFGLWICLLFIIFDLLKYCSKVCLEICTNMNIYLFKITPVVITNNNNNNNNENSNNNNNSILNNQQQQQQQQQPSSGPTTRSRQTRVSNPNTR